MSLEKMSPKNKKVEEVSGSEKKPSEKIDQLKQEINSLNKEFSQAHGSSHDDLEEKMIAKEKEIKKIEGKEKIDQLKQEINSLNKESSQAHGSRHDDLEEKMIAKEKEIKKIEGKEKIDQLKKEINSLNKEFSQAHGSSHDDLEEKMIAKENKIREIERGLKKGGEVDEGKIDNEKNTEDNIKNLEEKIDILEQQLENLQKRHESVSGTEKEDLEKTIIEKEEKIKGLKDQLESFQEKIKKEKEKKDESNFDKAGPEKGSEEEKGDAKDENVEKGELGPSKEDLDLLNKAREGLVEAEAAKKKYEGIMGKLKGFLDKDEKAEVVKEYEDALEEYQNAKYEYMDDIADEKIKIMDMRIKEFSEKRGWLLKIKKAYEKLGKWNLSNLLGDKWKEKVKSNKDDSFFKKALKFGARFGTQTLSVRFLISASLIGAGTVSGLGITAATGVLAARRLLVGLGTGLGGYDLLSMFGDKKALKKASENVTDDSLKDMDVNEITKRMAAFEQQAENSGSDEILKDPIYQKLSDRLGEKFNKIKEAEKKEKSIADKMDAIIKSTDENLDQKRLEHDKKNIKRKVVGTCIGMFFAGGLLNRIVGSFIGDDVPETSNGEVVSEEGVKTSGISFKPSEADYEAR